jgi:hypothetical protein
MTIEPTITVTGYFGKDKQITRADFIKTWRDHVQELTRLSCEFEFATKIRDWMRETEFEAAREFDRIHNEQTAAAFHKMMETAD